MPYYPYDPLSIFIFCVFPQKLCAIDPAFRLPGLHCHPRFVSVALCATACLNALDSDARYFSPIGLVASTPDYHGCALQYLVGLDSLPVSA